MMDFNFHYNQGLNFFKKGLLQKSETSYRSAIQLNPNHLNAHMQLGLLLSKMLRFEEATTHFQVICDTDPNNAHAHAALGEALSVLGRRKEAISVIKRAITIKPDFFQAKNTLHQIQSGRERATNETVKRWPILIDELKDFSQSAQEYVLGPNSKPAFTLTNEANFFTLGSCFAENLAKSLRAHGRIVKNLPFSEEINSTYANRHLIEWSLSRLEDEDLKASFDKSFPAIDPSEIEKSLSRADVVIFTVGVAPCFFSRETGRFVIPKSNNVGLWGDSFQFRTTSVSENKENLQKIIEMIQEINENIKIVLTLSPVPLKGTLNTPSVMQADSISKSTLRIAINEIMTNNPSGVSYWPSFEMVRWLGVYFENVFGLEDGRSRHVSSYVIDNIIELFLNHHSEDQEDKIGT